LTTLALFAGVMLLIGSAFAIPNGALSSKRIREQDATVLGASVLALGLGGMNLAFTVALTATGDVEGNTLLFALAPIVSGLLGASVVRSRVAGASRFGSLAAAALFVLVGIPGYFAPAVALLVSAIAAGLFLFGLVSDPKALIAKLDPRI
jgi:hypothetical protein